MKELEQSRKRAQKKPSEIRAHVFFSNISLIILCIFAGFLLLLLSGYIFDGKQEEWIVLSIVAVIIGVVAFFKTLSELAKVEIENSLITVIAKQGNDYLQNEGDRDELDNLFKRLSLENKSQPVMNRLIDHIVGEAKINKFDTGVNLIQPYKDESLDIIFSLQNYQKIALWIGIAGTFIGILKAMHGSEFRELLDSNYGEKLVQVIPLMFDGLVISFSASLAGLYSAVIIGFLILIIRRKQKECFQKMEKVINVILASAVKSKNRGKFLTEIDLLRNDLNDSQKLTKEMQFSNYQLQELISQTQNQIIKQNDRVHESVNKFLETNKLIDKVHEKTESEINLFRSDLNKSQKLTSDMQASNRQLQELVNQTQNQIMQQNNQVYESVNKFLETNKRIYEVAEKTEQEVRNINNAVLLKDALLQSIEVASQKMSVSIAEQVSMMTGQIIRFNEAADQLNNAVRSHNQILKNSSDQNIEVSKGISSNVNNMASAIRNLKMPQNLAKWVVVLSFILGIIIGGVGLLSASTFLSDSNKQNVSVGPDSNTNTTSNSNTNVVANKIPSGNITTAIGKNSNENSNITTNITTNK